MKRSKKYKKALEKLTADKSYTIDEAAKLLPELSTSNFPGTIELVFQLKLKEKQKNEMIRGSYNLPNTFGKQAIVLAFADKNNLPKAKDADIAGGEELIPDVESGKLKFDVVVATPEMMPKIAKLGRTLGTKGLMPSPKNGTVSADIDKVIARVKAGSRNFKMEKSGRITTVVGTTDMKPAQISENINTLVEIITQDIQRLGPDTIKYIKLSPTMGPSIQIVI